MWRHVPEVSVKLMLTSKNKYILCLFLLIFIARQMYNCSISVVGVRCEILFV